MRHFKPVPVTQTKAGNVEYLFPGMLLMQSDILAGGWHGAASTSQAKSEPQKHPKNMPGVKQCSSTRFLWIRNSPWHSGIFQKKFFISKLQRWADSHAINCATEPICWPYAFSNSGDLLRLLDYDEGYTVFQINVSSPVAKIHWVIFPAT